MKRTWNPEKGLAETPVPQKLGIEGSGARWALGLRGFNGKSTGNDMEKDIVETESFLASGVQGLRVVRREKNMEARTLSGIIN